MIIQYNGLISFRQGLELQDQAVDSVGRSGRPVCLGCEHYPVITLGKRAGPGEILGSQWELKDRGFEVVETDRGGQATLHSPGQLVIYPILPLRDYQISVRDYVSLLEETTIKWLATQKISAQKKEETGIFTSVGKIAFIGIRVEKGICRHGISINISNNLELFQWISACGMRQRPLDSVALASDPRRAILTPEQAFEGWVNIFIHELIGLRSKTPLQGSSKFDIQ
jgi:lipoate-protein ligase B